MSTSAELTRERAQRVERVRLRRPDQPPRRGWGTAAGMAVVALVLLVALVPLAASLHVVKMAKTHVTAPSDAIVVLGAAQFNGTPTPVFANRLDHARELYDAGIAPTIITVGGKQPGDAYTEADAGRSYLIEAGVPAESIIAVEEGSDTLTSLTPAAGVMADLGIRDVTIVSDPTHMARSLAIADRLGMNAQPNGTSMGDGTNVTAEYVSRETVGYLYFLLAEQWPVSQVLADPAN